MTRFLKPASLKSFVLLFVFLAAAQAARATTVIIPTDNQMIIGARAIVVGKVLAVETAVDDRGRIYTYTTVKVQSVLKGQISVRRIVVKEMGGEFGDRGAYVFGAPQYARGEEVLLYLDTWNDGSLRTFQMFLGKFSVVRDPQTGEAFVVRSTPDPQVEVAGQASGGTVTGRLELSAYVRMVRRHLAENWAASQANEQAAYGNTPVLARPPEYLPKVNSGDVEAQFHLFSPPLRWFEPDSGQPVSFKTNPASTPSGTILGDVAAVMNTWSTVAGCSLRVADGGTTEGTGLYSVDGENTIFFNNADNYFTGSGNCSSNILAVAVIAAYDRSQTRVVNGTTFYKIIESNISFNPFSACNFGNDLNVQEITQHEMGHALGLHHSWQPSFGGSPTSTESAATMYYIAHFDGRGASIRPDDIAGITMIYPGTGGGGGSLSVTTSSLPSGTVNTAYAATLQASGGTPPYTWSLTSGALPAGLSLNAATGVINGTPTTATTANFTVQVRDSATPAATASKPLSIVINSSGGGGGTYNAQFVSQTVPTTLTPGQVFNATIIFLNSGTANWNETGLYYLASQNPPLNSTWGGNGLPLDSLLPTLAGQQLTINFQATAPTTPGTYNFQWQMYRNDSVVGYFGVASTNVAIQVGNSSPPPPTTHVMGDLDGDGKSDVSFYRNGMWGFLKSSQNLSYDSSTYFTWGGSGMPPITADFDGDGKADLAYCVPPANGQSASYSILLSSHNYSFASGQPLFVPAGFPSVGDTPVVGDFDGDGKADPAIWRASQGVWIIPKSSGSYASFIFQQWGQPGDVPIVADIDGDGKADMGFYRDGLWGFLKSSKNYSTDSPQFFSWGASGLQPVVGDFDGDGKADIGYVAAPANGQSASYSILLSSHNYSFASGQPLFVPAGFPSVGDTPVVGDFDGDGKADPAVWRASQGAWIIPTSSSNFTQYIIKQWGQQGDVAVPNSLTQR